MARRHPNYGRVRKNGEVIINERCRCGHLGTRHRDLIPGVSTCSGACMTCDCPRFSFKKRVTTKLDAASESAVRLGDLDAIDRGRK